MGSSQSVNNKSYQDIKNAITQISEQHCINVVRNASEINLTFVNTIARDITITSAVFINGASCNLKASLSSDILNELTNVQKGEVENETGLKTDIFPWQSLASVLSNLGSSMDVTNENYQQVVNQVTQILNSSCQNKVLNEDAPINQVFEGSKLRDLNVNAELEISNTNCSIENFVKSLSKNDLSNDQDATVKKSVGSLGALGGIILIIIIIALLPIILGSGLLKKKNN